MHAITLLALVGSALVALAASYAVLVLAAALVWRARRPAVPAATRPPVTVLKPLCGTEPNLYEHLGSFCVQDYPDFQLVFGSRDPLDPALAEVRGLADQYPQLPMCVSVSPRQHGGNRKVSNLINMFGDARHDLLVLADSDVSVSPAYLSAVTAPLQDPGVGLVTCLYRALPRGSVWSRLGAMYVNDWYVPSALLAHAFGFRDYAFGPTLCLRRDTLQAIGGFQEIADHLADDYRLGELIRRRGLRIVLSPYMVDTHHAERDLVSLIRHERRWMYTLRILRPRSFCLLFLTFSVPLAIVGMLLAAVDPAFLAPAGSLFGVTALARLGLHLAQRPRGPLTRLWDLLLLPIRDLLTCWIWCSSFSRDRVSWRGAEFDVRSDGIMRREC